MPKQKTEYSSSLSKSEKVRLNRLYSRVRADYDSARNLSKASGLSKIKEEQFSQTETPYNNCGSPIRHFQRLQVSKYVNALGFCRQTSKTKTNSNNEI